MSSTIRLVGVHPALADAVRRILAAMEILGVPMTVTDGVRTDEQQAALFAQRPRVTRVDGYKRKSMHQIQADGFGHAVDCAFLKGGKPSWSEQHPWSLYGEAARVLGLRWGGDWVRFLDRPHVELPLTRPDVTRIA